MTDAEQNEDERALREMLAIAYAGAALYTDDGEAQDNRCHPCIDFLRDPVAEIRRKMLQRGTDAVEDFSLDAVSVVPDPPPGCDVAVVGHKGKTIASFGPVIPFQPVPSDAEAASIAASSGLVYMASDCDSQTGQVVRRFTAPCEGMFKIGDLTVCLRAGDVIELDSTRPLTCPACGATDDAHHHDVCPANPRFRE